MDTKNQTPHINVDYFEDLTGDVSPSEGVSVEAVGDKISKLRQDKGISLEEMSNLTGFETDVLDKIEKNQIQPQLGTIIKLSQALDSAFSRLVSDVGSKLYSVTRKSDQKAVARSTSRKSQKQLYQYKSLAPEVQGRHMEALIVTLEEKPDVEPSVHGGEEFIYVLEGKAELKIGEDLFVLEPGDSVYYLSTTPHLIAGKDGQATILAVLYSK
jgi:quercetin dioxygenase-like cupin family protein